MRNIRKKVKALHIWKRVHLIHRYKVMYYRYIPPDYVYSVSTNNGVIS